MGVKVWSRFTVQKPDGTVLKLRIQDMPSDRLEEVVELYVKYFITEETLQRSTGIYKNETAVSNCRKSFEKMRHQPPCHVSVCCVDDGDTVGDIMGVSAIVLVTEDDDKRSLEVKQTQTEEQMKMDEIFGGLQTMHDVRNTFGVSRYSDCRGIVVTPSYRRLGIATEFLKARRPVCLEYGIPLTVGWMTSQASQKAADRASWKTSYEVPFEELARKFGVNFEGAPDTCKMMYDEVK